MQVKISYAILAEMLISEEKDEYIKTAVDAVSMRRLESSQLSVLSS